MRRLLLLRLLLLHALRVHVRLTVRVPCIDGLCDPCIAGLRLIVKEH